jgi:hypothetical protein
LICAKFQENSITSLFFIRPFHDLFIP